MDEFQIFISYRRLGGEDMAGRIADRLRMLGYSVFYDVESMRAGKFNSQIYSAIDGCTDVLVVLPQNALDRCSDPEDWVRMEIAYAIEKKKNIIPILMHGFKFPNDLPENIKAISDFEGIKVPEGFFDALIARLIELIQSEKRSKDSQNANDNYSEITYEDGAAYSGSVVNGLFHGKGVLKYSTGETYSGYWAGGVRSGEGVMIWKNGEQWQGEFFAGAPYNGKGTWMYFDSSKEVGDLAYIGAFVNGKCEGDALYVWSNGGTCKGFCKNGLFTGNGTWRYKTGKYEGRFVKSKRHGKGTLSFSRYEKFVGTFKNDYMFYGKWSAGSLSLDGDFKGFFKQNQPFLGRWSKYRKITLFGKSFYL